MNKKIGWFLLSLFIISCGPKVHFITVGRERFPAKEKEAEILVFYTKEKPKQKYKVVGLLFVEDITPTLFPPQVSDPKIIKAFTKAAKKYGADAIIDLKIISGHKNIPDTDRFIDIRKIKRAEAKAIKFIEKRKS